MKLVFNDPSFSFELLRAIGYAPYGGADISECLMTAYAIQEGNEESWYTQWRLTAERIHEVADSTLAKGHLVSAREAYLRAANYYRTSEFFLRQDPGNDPRVHETSRLGATCFSEAAKLFAPQFEAVEIPYQNTTLPGYFYRVDNSGKPRPTLLFMGGFDSTVEELYWAGAAAALRRDYNCLTVDGPGQGRVIREQLIPFRYDWEQVVTPIVDFALTLPEIVPNQIALMGMSMGGYLAPRAAAFEHRLAALICYDGVFDNNAPLMQSLPPFIGDWLAKSQDEAVNQVMGLLISRNTQLRWTIHNSMWTYGVSTPVEAMRANQAYTLAGVAQQIQCPTLVCDAENDQFFHGQAQQLYDALTCAKTYLPFTAAEGAEEHCQEGALLYFHQRVFDWLDETLNHAQVVNKSNDKELVVAHSTY